MGEAVSVQVLAEVWLCLSCRWSVVREPAWALSAANPLSRRFKCREIRCLSATGARDDRWAGRGVTRSQITRPRIWRWIGGEWNEGAAPPCNRQTDNRSNCRHAFSHSARRLSCRDRGAAASSAAARVKPTSCRPQPTGAGTAVHASRQILDAP